MKKRLLNKLLSLTLTCSLLLPLAGCGSSAQTIDLMDGVKTSEVPCDANLTGDTADAITDFSVRLLNQSLNEDGNTLISPFSVLCALAMTSNGAKGETLAQMEEVFGLSISDLNTYLHTYADQLPEDEKYKLSIANSIWFKDDKSFTVEEDFLQTNADYYGAEMYKAPFDDSTLKDINNWVDDNTDGMIDEILSEIPSEAYMYLINALAFDAEWMNVYDEYQVQKETFTQEDGTARNAELMYSTEYTYLEDENAVGFVKYYADAKYAFAALLPNEGVSVADYTASLTGEKLHTILSNPLDATIDAAIPKFETEYDVKLNQTLLEMGMTDAFSANADFTGIGTFDSTDNNLSISEVIHKTFISVDESGTKAGAATSVGVTKMSLTDPRDIKTVHLDRPFVYMLIDCEANLPLFIGTMMDIEK